MPITRRNFLQAGAALAAAPKSSFAANDRVQIGVIGTGARSQELMQALVTLPGNEIVGVVDAYAGRVQRTLERLHGRPKVFKNYHELLGQPSIDAVVVATPDHWHRRMVLDAVGAGKDVYCEKPLTYASSEGPEIIRAANKSGRIVQVGSQGMSSQIQRKAKQMIQAGDLGQVTLIRATFNRNTASGAWIYPIPPDASPETVNWEMFLGPAPKRPFSLERFFRWRCYRDYSGGIATDLFVHLCTTIHFLYREGFVVNLSATFNNQASAEGSFQFLGTEGTINLGRGLSFYPEHPVEDNRWIVESWPQELEKAYYQDPKVRQTELVNTRPPAIVEGPRHRQFREEGQNSTIAHLRHFLESVRSRKPYWEDAAAGHHAAACAHMINRSAEQQRLVEWDFARDDIKA